MRRIPALVSTAAAATVLAAALAGCSGSSTDASACTPTVKPGDASALVTATGPVGSKPAVELPAPLVAETPQRSVLATGDGLVAEKGMTVDFAVSAFEATTGTELLSVGFDKPTDPNASSSVRYRAGASASDTAEVSSLANALVCAQAGDRIALVTSVADSRLSFTPYGLTDSDTIVFVVDVQAVFPAKADGINQLPQDGMPTVVTAPDGTPGITIPNGPAPEKTRIATIKAGGGETVAEGDRVVANLTVWVWPAKDGERPVVTDSTWGVAPSTLTIAEDVSGAAGVVPALYRALLGSTIGSQLLVVAAPADTYGDGAWPEATTKGDTLVYVVDVLGIESPVDTAK